MASRLIPGREYGGKTACSACYGALAECLIAGSVKATHLNQVAVSGWLGDGVGLPEVGEDGCHPPVDFLLFGEAKLGEDRADVLLHG